MSEVHNTGQIGVGLQGLQQVDAGRNQGQLGGQPVRHGGWSAGRIALAVLTLGISEIVRAIGKAISHARQAEPPAQGRAATILNPPQAQQTARLDIAEREAPQRSPSEVMRNSFEKWGATDATQAKQLLRHMQDIATALPEEDAVMLNQRLFGGGNTVFRAVYDDPGILSDAIRPEARRQRFDEAHDRIGAELLESTRRSAERQTADMTSGREDAMYALVEGARLTLQANADDGFAFIDTSEGRKASRGFVESCRERGLTVDSAMAALRGRQNIRDADLGALNGLVERLFAGEELSHGELDQLDGFFPGHSS